MIKSFLIAVAATSAFAIGSVATPDSAKADDCFRGRGGYGYYAPVPSYRVGYYGYRAPRVYGGPAVYVAPRRTSFYRGYAPHPYYYGPRGGGVSFAIGF